jgi:predicted DsbA family dithiol-disulfide isomerase
VQRELEGRARFSRRCFLLLPGVGERPVHDDYVISHRRAARERAPGLGFAIPAKGHPYPRSSVPAQLLALRVQAAHPERLEALEDALYRAVCVDLADVADPDVLRRAATTAGVPEDEVDRALGDPALLRQAAREHEEAVEHGIRGIPALLVPGQPPLVGAQPVEAYRAALERAGASSV